MSNHRTISDPITSYGLPSHPWSNCPGEPGVDGDEYAIDKRMATAAPVVIMMITPGVFLTGHETENNDAGSLGIDTERPVEHFVFDSGEQIERNSLTV